MSFERVSIYVIYRLASLIRCTGINEPHEGLRRTESQWPVHQINWQKSRYIYDMFYVYHKISREVYEHCIKNKLVDAALIAKWKKAGYERLCSTYVINQKNYKFGTVSICRVPSHCLAPGTVIEDSTTGCHGCASGPGGHKNIFGNKYGQYLAAIQIAREEKLNREASELFAKELDAKDKESDEDSDSGSDDFGPTAPTSVWADEKEEDRVALPEVTMGRLSHEAESEGLSAIRRSSDSNPPKKQRTV
jgi:bud site selection protein 31